MNQKGRRGGRLTSWKWILNVITVAIESFLTRTAALKSATVLATLQFPSLVAIAELLSSENETPYKDDGV